MPPGVLDLEMISISADSECSVAYWHYSIERAYAWGRGLRPMPEKRNSHNKPDQATSGVHIK